MQTRHHTAYLRALAAFEAATQRLQDAAAAIEDSADRADDIVPSYIINAGHVLKSIDTTTWHP